MKSIVFETLWHIDLEEQIKCKIKEFLGDIVILMREKGLRKVSLNLWEWINNLSRSVEPYQSHYQNIDLHVYTISKNRYGVSCWNVKTNNYIAHLKIEVEKEEAK